jgi:ABC-type multidrug transport system fused ATPase/permease subunit
MLLEKINIESKLRAHQTKLISEFEILNQIKNIFENDEIDRNEIINRLIKISIVSKNKFDLDLLETNKIFHLKSIKQTCIDYRLRFLDSKLFKNKIPEEAISKIKDLEKIHNTTFEGFKIMAPAKLFKLEKSDDPLLFIPLGNEYFYLVHKWGNDLNPFRKIMMIPFKSMGNIVVTLIALSAFTTLFLPVSKFGPENINIVKFISFLFVFKTYCAIVVYYSFWKGKNFSGEIWNSNYSN